MSRRQVNMRLPELTRDQLTKLCRWLAASEATVTTVAIDRMYQRETNRLATAASAPEEDTNENCSQLQPSAHGESAGDAP